MPTEPGTLTQRFWGDRRIRVLRGRILELQCTTSQKGENSLAMNVFFPRLVARDLVPEPAGGFSSRLQLHQRMVDLFRLGEHAKRRLASEYGRKLVPAPSYLRQREVRCLQLR